MTFGSLFSGIGGLDLGLERAGMRCIWQCEIDPYCNRVLAKHWPDVRRYGDVRDIGAEVERPDLICGGFPCQPFSVAGSRLREADERNLWPEMLRVVAAVHPRWVLVENVAGFAASAYFERVCCDLENLDYEVLPLEVSALQLGADHTRVRSWPLAHSKRAPLREQSGRSSREDWKVEAIARSHSWWTIEPGMGRVAHGIPHQVDRLRALGNAVVPQVAEWIGSRIMEAHITAPTKETP